MITVSFTSYTGMDLPLGPYSDNYNEVRGRTLFTNKKTSRNLSISSTKSSVVYHKRMTNNNNIDINEDINNNSPTLSYEDEQKKTL